MDNALCANCRGLYGDRENVSCCTNPVKLTTVAPDAHGGAVAARPVEDLQLRDKALRVSELMVNDAFEGRKGHGGGPCASRVLTRQQLQVYLALAFEYGSKWEVQR